MVSHAKKKRLDFDDPNSLTDEDIVSLTGITKEQFEFLVSSVSKLKKSANRSPRTAIAILLVKLKTGLSHRYLATLFGIGSKRKVSKIVQQAKSALSEDFVPSYIGFHHISRDEIIENHTTNFATQLFNMDMSANFKDDKPNQAVVKLCRGIISVAQFNWHQEGGNN
ncbi:unnamed protein product [Mytilus edulis]|uniref:Transposase Helix-turn-helix domain-containing protein n=1 Tax=Mytilus edulis TaxID=6550 RepID=A0A8S3RB43_MYTED|nr:unnamed protein product [Mytilus edulis]